MIDRESDIRPIGYGAMLVEGLVGIVALIAATAMFPGDYFAINTPPAAFATLGMPVVNLPDLQAAVGETVAGRPGGAVSLAIGIAQIFSGLPGMRGLMDYWYHFAIMFEALFILTTIDTGTRVARFLVQEFLGRFYAPMARHEWVPGSVISTLMVVTSWGYFIWTGSISTIWPMFGVANQLLASVALAVGTTIIINQGKARYAWVTLLPLSFVSVTTMTAGVLSVRDIFWPLAIGPNPATHVQGYVNTAADRDHAGVRGRNHGLRGVALGQRLARADRGGAGHQLITARAFVLSICHPPSAILHLPSAICHLPSSICHLPFAICHLPSPAASAIGRSGMCQRETSAACCIPRPATNGPARGAKSFRSSCNERRTEGPFPATVVIRYVSGYG